MRALFFLLVVLLTAGCEAQLQKWQKTRVFDHLARLKNYHGHMTWSIADEFGESEVWFESPNHFLVVSKSGDVARSDGKTLEIYDSITKFYSVFENLPPTSESAQTKFIGDTFDESMKNFTFVLGRIGKVADQKVIELRGTPKNKSILQKTDSQILDEYSIPLKQVLTFADGETAKFEFTQILINQNEKLPPASIPKISLKLKWDFNAKSITSAKENLSFKTLKLEKTLKRETGEVLSYYSDGARYLMVIRFKNLGLTPQLKGIGVKLLSGQAFLQPGLFSNTLTAHRGDTTSIFSSNLLLDDLIAFATLNP